MTAKLASASTPGTPGELILLIGLLTGVALTALAVVHAAHVSRGLNNDLAQLQKLADRQRIEYDRLLLEQGSWASHGRVTELAVKKLSMEAPDPFAIVIVK